MNVDAGVTSMMGTRLAIATSMALMNDTAATLATGTTS
jgi:hypothetical protein